MQFYSVKILMFMVVEEVWVDKDGWNIHLNLLLIYAHRKWKSIKITIYGVCFKV